MCQNIKHVGKFILMSAASADGLFYSHASVCTINTQHTLNSYLCYFLDTLPSLKSKLITLHG